MPDLLPEPLPKRLNLGCGWDIRPGFLNVDFVPAHNPDLVADVTNLPMLPSGYFDEIVAQDVLEHFERGKTSGALAEWSRLLSDTGTLKIRVPSLFHMIDLLAEAEPQGFEAAAKIVHLIYGTQAYTGDYHLAGFTPAILQEKLSSAGLVVSDISLRDTWLFDVSAGKSATASAPEWPRSRIERARADLEAFRSENARRAPLRAYARRMTEFIRAVRKLLPPSRRHR